MKKDRVQMTKDFFRSYIHNAYKLDDRFVIRDGKKHPLAIICPGGAYSVVCNFIEGIPFATKLNEYGISAINLYYHVKGKAKYPMPLDDLARAVREIGEKAEEYGVDMDHYSIWGSSAGGHLAGCFGTDELGYAKYGLPKPECLVLIYPVITMHKDITNYRSRKYFIGEDASEELESMVSVDEHVTADFPRTFLWCGSEDKSVPPVNCNMMDEALKKNGIDHKFILYPGVEHGVGLADDIAAARWLPEAVAFWQGKE